MMIARIMHIKLCCEQPVPSIKISSMKFSIIKWMKKEDVSSIIFDIVCMKFPCKKSHRQGSTKSQSLQSWIEENYASILTDKKLERKQGKRKTNRKTKIMGSIWWHTEYKVDTYTNRQIDWKKIRWKSNINRIKNRLK